MIRFKKYILSEGWGAVKRDFVKTGKLSEDDLKWMKIALKGWINDDKGKLGEWLAKWWITYRKKNQSFDNFYDLRLRTREVEDFLYAIENWSNMSKSGIVKGNPPLKDMKEFAKHVKKIGTDYYSKKKMSIPSSLTKEDYEEVFNKDGVQVWKIKTSEAIVEIGKGTKWCVTDRTTWNNYNYNQNLRFYVVRNHRLNSDDPKYKLAVVVDSKNKINSIWNAPDAKLITFPTFFSVPTKTFKWFEIPSRNINYSEDQIKKFEGWFDDWIKDLEREHKRYKIEEKIWNDGNKVMAEFSPSYVDGSWEDFYFDAFDGFGFHWDWMFGLQDLSGFYTEVMAGGDEGEMAPFIDVIHPVAKEIIKTGKADALSVKRIRPKNIIKEYSD